MAKGISIHVGLNYVDPNHYSGWDGELNAAEYDAEDMFLIATSQGFQSKIFLRGDATRNAIITAISEASAKLIKEDIFLISYSGHGGQLPDINGDEEDSIDETWCLFDGEIVDDELSQLWSNFSEGVRILVVSDSCHSGTVVKNAINYRESEKSFGAKFMPPEISASTYIKNKDFYDGILNNVDNVDSVNIKASVKLISGCQDNQNSYDGTFNGQFTAALKRVWNGGKFKGDYSSFHKQIMNLLPDYQTPNLYDIGSLNSIFNSQIPFNI